MRAPDAQLLADRDQIQKFVETIFRNGKMEGFVSLRAFYQKDNEKFRITSVNLAGKALDAIIEAAVKEATLAAQEPRPVNFCPPLAIFKNRYRAREVDLLAGLVISVEADSRPQVARERLAAVLGPPTIVVESGGIWTDPESGEVEDKLHLHWRLARPAADEDAFAKLKAARTLACTIVGGDASNNPIVHPIRWPGSWHRKSEPRLARIIALDAEREIELDAALALLTKAAEENGDLRDEGPHESGPAQTDPKLAAIAIDNIPNDWVKDEESWIGWSRIGMALYRAAGYEDGRKIFHTYSAKSKQGRYNEENTDKRWESFHSSPPTQLGAGTLFRLAREANPTWRDEFDRAIEARFSINPAPTTASDEPAAASPTKAAKKAEGKYPLIIELATKLWGPITYHGGDDYRFGDNNSKSVDFRSRTWFDFTTNVGGGLRDLMKLAASSPAEKSSIMICAADIEMKPKEWIWKGHLLRGAVELMSGLPGLGKSQVQICTSLVRRPG